VRSIDAANRMSDRGSGDASNFDGYADSYDHDLAQGLSATGEDRDYYARRRVEWLRGCLDRLRFVPTDTIEFGFGTGSNVPFLIEVAGATSVVGLDTSGRSLEVARNTFGSPEAHFYGLSEYEPEGKADLVFCNGVFHHIPPADRAAAVEYLYRCLKPGGLLALWENNPWNPGTRYIMSRVSFDRDAITLVSSETQGLVRRAGFQVVRTDFLFIFPHFLRWFRGLEPRLSKLPIGGQYELLCRKPLE
jgi:SAM-dependent methyltransferase